MGCEGMSRGVRVMENSEIIYKLFHETSVATQIESEIIRLPDHVYVRTSDV